MQLSGINQCQTNVNESCDVQIKSRNGKFSKLIQCLALEEITGTLPPTKIDISNLNLPSHIELADPEFDRPDSIDILLGGGLVWSIIHNNTINLGSHLPVLRETTFGWVIAGEHQIQSKQTNKLFVNCATLEIQEQLKQFWNLEEYEPKKVLSNEEKFCETNFVSTTIRNHSGKFIVDLPFKRNPSILGNSFQIAQRRFLNQERKLKLNDTLYTAYKQFMQEYIDLEHMTETRIENIENETSYYLPHHSVLKEDRTTTKLCVVFDGSAKTTSGLSLNDILCVGPQIQDDLISILIRFRTYKYAMTADIEKMYRQVLVNEKHCKLQKILWRKSDSEPIKAYNLRTVTYGTASGAYLATRCLHEAANLVESTLPDIAAMIRTDFYVDDFLSGANSITDAAQICESVSKILNAVGFPLRKWASNNTNVIQHLSGYDTYKTYNLGKNENTNTLGLLWATKTDELSYKINIQANINGTLTKRKILSSIAQIFDPLGMIAPLIINAKILLQGLWLIKLDWDDKLSDNCTLPYKQFLDNIAQLPNLKVPRIAMQTNYETLQVHGFSDASEKAYGACIYLRTTRATKVECSLLIAKTRVAPIKTQTIPRLELCGALLLARLVEKTLKSLRITPLVFLWTDSSIVLGWLTMNPSLLKPFVSHRIAEIQTLLPNAIWRHVSTKSNPADIASRGATYNELITSFLWWKGPSWLTQSETVWPLKVFKRSSELPEMKRVSLPVKLVEPLLKFENYSTITHIERVIAFCLRFVHNARNHKSQERREGPLMKSELKNALFKIVKIAQNISFGNEIKALSAGTQISASSRILSLSPFIDSDGILRVGGRLQNAKFLLGKRHPALLSSKQHIAKLIMRREHIRLLHIGPQGLLYAVRDTFWITSGKSLANQIVHQCMSCFRAKPRGVQTKMGNLPAVRVNISFPFENTGIDYAGPIWLKTSNTRDNKRYKAYICVFVCLCTKAVHLDVVSSLTTNAFIACLRRFVSRRGLPRCILSDNGTNFVGANRELKELSDFLNKNRHSLSESATKHEIDWQFSPPRAPHFGGIWEAAVRSMKNHLKRVVGERILTHEDFYTFLCQVQAVLNSRPLTPLSTNPNDVTPLSPAHFLIGRSIRSLPDTCVIELPENRLTSYQKIQAMLQHFWQRWVKEYLGQLQVRTKWKKNNVQAHEIKLGSLVLISDEALPPFCWKTGRITAVHEGTDGIVRVVTVKRATSEFQRPVSKVHPLPIEESTV